MRRGWLLIGAFAAATACGGNGSSADRLPGEQPLTIEVPATIVGELEISVEEGPVGNDDISEVNFGSVETSDGAVLIEVWADVVRAAGLSREDLVAGRRYRVELGEEAEYSTAAAPSYRVVSLAPDG